MKLLILLVTHLFGSTLGEKPDCIPSGRQILVAEVNSIKRIETDGSLTSLIPNLSHTSTVAYDSDAGYIFYGNFMAGGIYRTNMDGTDVKTIVPTSITRASFCITLDKTKRRLFWTDQKEAKIFACNYDGSSVQEIIKTDLRDPTGIDVDPVNGHIYWLDHGLNELERSSMDGSNRLTILHVFGNPRGLALDVPNGKIYFSASKTEFIVRCNLDGSDREIIQIGVSHASYLTLYDGYIYFASSKLKTLERVRVDGTGRETVKSLGPSEPHHVQLIPGSPIREAIICDESETLSCPKGYEITVLKAFYGRIDDTTCPATGGPTDCIFSGASTTVQALCNGRETCTVSNSISSFPTDPCPSVAKYTKVKYKCCKEQSSGGEDCQKSFCTFKPQVDGCTSINTFFRATCHGGCENSRYEADKPEKKRMCCEPVHPYSVPATIDCGDGTEKAIIYTDFASCECRECEEKPEESSCKPETVRIQPYIKDCEPASDFPVRLCRGGCSSMGLYVFGTDQLMKDCKCCVPERKRWVSQRVKCKDGSRKTVRYQMADSCECEICSPMSRIPGPPPVEAPSSGRGR